MSTDGENNVNKTKKKKIAFKEKVRIPKAKVLQSNNYSMMTLKTRR